MSEDEERPRRVNPADAGQPVGEESGSTAGRTHDQVLDATLPHDLAVESKVRRTRGNLKE